MSVFLFTHTHTQIASKPRKKNPKSQEGDDARGKKRGGRPGSELRVSKRLKLKPGDPGYDPYDFSSGEDDDVSESPDHRDESHDQIPEAMETSQEGRVELGDER